MTAGGGTEEPGVEGNFPADVGTRETADLFLVLIIELLKHNGRAAVVYRMARCSVRG
jgi:type I restriction enzyme M protein